MPHVDACGCHTSGVCSGRQRRVTGPHGADAGARTGSVYVSETQFSSKWSGRVKQPTFAEPDPPQRDCVGGTIATRNPERSIAFRIRRFRRRSVDRGATGTGVVSGLPHPHRHAVASHEMCLTVFRRLSWSALGKAGFEQQRFREFSSTGSFFRPDRQQQSRSFADVVRQQQHSARSVEQQQSLTATAPIASPAHAIASTMAISFCVRLLRCDFKVLLDVPPGANGCPLFVPSDGQTGMMNPTFDSKPNPIQLRPFEGREFYLLAESNARPISPGRQRSNGVRFRPPIGKFRTHSTELRTIAWRIAARGVSKLKSQ